MTLEGVPRTHVSIAGHRHGAFYTTGWLGFWLAAALTISLCAATGLSVLVQAAIAALSAIVYFSIVRVARRVYGRQALIYYHHVLAFLAVAAVFAAVLGEPVLAYLDVTACGLGLFTAVARVGCLMVGCCHGQPARHGIPYGPEHERYGIPLYLVGVRLMPVQAIEAAGCLLLAIAGSAAVLAGAAAGTALTIFLAGYAALRFALEWLRGDLARPYALGLSEAQWTSLGLALVVAALAATDVLPGGPTAILPAVVLLVAAVATVLGRVPRHRELLAPTHVRELAHRLGGLEPSRPDHVITTVTSRGLQVSMGETRGYAHYTLSTDAPLDAGSDVRLARLVLWICRDESEPELIPGGDGAIHVVTPRRLP